MRRKTRQPARLRSYVCTHLSHSNPNMAVAIDFNSPPERLSDTRTSLRDDCERGAAVCVEDTIQEGIVFLLVREDKAEGVPCRSLGKLLFPRMTTL